MARGVGELVVTLALNAVNYTAGLTKAEKDAKAFTQRIRTSIVEVGKVLGGLAVGKAVFDATKNIIGQASALNDLADVTGSSVEALSKLSNQAGIAGADMAQLETALAKLSVGMADTSEEGSKAQQALKVLGITARDPVEAMTQAGAKLAQFEDGVNKVGLAAALFGAKAGPRFLATLKDISELSDVNATITKKQAQEAEELEKAYRRLDHESRQFANAILNDVVPALTRMIVEFRDGLTIAGSFLGALRLFGTLNPFDKPREGITKLTKEIEELENSRKSAGRFGPGELTEIDSMIADRRKQIEFLKLQERQAIRIDPNDTNVRDILMQRKPQAPPLPDKGKSSSGKILDQELRRLEGLIRDEEETLRDREGFLRTYYSDDLIGLREFFAGRNAALQEAFAKESAILDQQAELLRNRIKTAPDRDARIDAEGKLEEVLRKRARLQQDVASQSVQLYLEEARAIRQLRDSVEQAAIALAEMRGDSVTAALASFDFANRQIRAQLQLLQSSPNPADQALGAVGNKVLDDQRELILLRARLTKATDEYRLTLDELGIAQARIDNAQEAGAITSLGALRARSDLAAQYTERLRAQLRAAQELAAQEGTRENIVRVQQLQVELEKLANTGDLVAKQFDQIFAVALEQALTDAVSGTKSLKDAFNDMVKSIVAGINRIAAQNIAEALFGGGGKAGGQAGSLLAQLLGFLFAGGSSGGGVPGVGFSGGGFGEHFAAGGVSRGGLAMVGESGPELVNLPAGARVYSNNDTRGMLGGKSVSIVQNINVQPGANTQSAKQIAKQLAAITSSAVRDR